VAAVLAVRLVAVVEAVVVVRTPAAGDRTTSVMSQKLAS
jgi:hypothetical protein